MFFTPEPSLLWLLLQIARHKRFALRILARTWLEQRQFEDTLAPPFDERLALLVDAEMLARTQPLARRSSGSPRRASMGSTSRASASATSQLWQRG